MIIRARKVSLGFCKVSRVSGAVTTYGRLRDSVSRYFSKGRGGEKGESGYGRAGFVVGTQGLERRRARKCFPPSLEVILYIKEEISIETRELEVVGM